jgi:very-short-patch-repair endonuclease
VIAGPRPSIKLARKFRSEMSFPETLHWQQPRHRPGNHKFRRQHPAGPFVLDFFCAQATLAIEVAGISHDSHNGARRDANCSAFLKARGIGTLRVPARVVLEDVEVAVKRIVEVCSKRLAVPLHRPTDGPPPRSGEELR